MDPHFFFTLDWSQVWSKLLKIPKFSDNIVTVSEVCTTSMQKIELSYLFYTSTLVFKPDQENRTTSARDPPNIILYLRKRENSLLILHKGRKSISLSRARGESKIIFLFL